MSFHGYRIPGKLAMIVPLLAVTMFIQGCETLNKGVYGTEHAEITPFAQKTVEIIGVSNMLLRDDEFVWLRAFADDDFAELDRLQSLLAVLDFFRSNIVSYSVELVRVSEVYGSGPTAVEAFADSVDENLRVTVIERLKVTEQEWNAVLSNIRSQKDLLGGLRAFQPIVNTAGEVYAKLMDEIESSVLFDVRAGFDQRIQAEYADILEFEDRHYRYRDELFRALVSVDDYRLGDVTAIQDLRNQNFLIDPALLATDQPDYQQTRRLHLELQNMLIESTTLLQSYYQEREDYLAVRSELDKKEIEILNDITLARLQFTSWAQAHQALANGVKEPGTWMALAVQAGKLASKSVEF